MCVCSIVCSFDWLCVWLVLRVFRGCVVVCVRLRVLVSVTVFVCVIVRACGRVIV